MELNDYQARASQTDQNPPPAKPEVDFTMPHRHEVIPLLGLVGEVGSLLGEYKKLLRDGSIHRKFPDEVAEELGDILWYVANAASKFGLSLNEIAVKNLSKVEDRWRSSDGERILYDCDNPEDQQLPRCFQYRFEECMIAGAKKLLLVDQLCGEATGDPLTDNAYEDDGYRFHDVMHLAFAACLGWSPVLRKLLRKKEQIVNRTPSRLDDVEDGGRAQVIEEAIVAAAYVYASNHGFLEGIGAIDWRLLRHIKEMTSHLEVKNVSTGEWNDALLCGFAVWRKLWNHRGGLVCGDLNAGTLRFSPLTPREQQ